LLTFILAEAALGTVPENLWSHPAIRRQAKRQNKFPQQLLLDRSFHHSAMNQLVNNKKRGRPDITHFVLLEALGSPLNKENLLQIYIHTYEDYVITVNPSTRLPRNCIRFNGLMEQLFQLRKVPSGGKTLLKLEQKTMPQLIADIEPDYVLAFSKEGKPKTIQDAVWPLKLKHRPVVIVGGFAHGHFLDTTSKLANEIVSVDVEMLEAWTIASRIIYEYEKSLSLHTKRFSTSPF
jgi:rRNA small subunit pseudouridine methyltransferase Nep1